MLQAIHGPSACRKSGPAYLNNDRMRMAKADAAPEQERREVESANVLGRRRAMFEKNGGPFFFFCCKKYAARLSAFVELHAPKLFFDTLETIRVCVDRGGMARAGVGSEQSLNLASKKHFTFSLRHARPQRSAASRPTEKRTQ